jgi:hypothetical protein
VTIHRSLGGIERVQRWRDGVEEEASPGQVSVLVAQMRVALMGLCGMEGGGDEEGVRRRDSFVLRMKASCWVDRAVS